MKSPTIFPSVPILLEQMSDTLRIILANQKNEARMIGIHTGGVWVGEGLHDRLELAHPMGNLDITYFRDDLVRGGRLPHVRSSHLPWSIDNQLVILVDDILHTGRTVRAAINEIFDFGRPKRILLAVLIDRGGHELPIAADIIGARYNDLDPSEKVKLNGPAPLNLTLMSKG